MEFVNKITRSSKNEEILEELTGDLQGEYDFGILFFSQINNTNVETIVSSLRSKVRIKSLLACTCAGIISSQEEFEYKSAVSLLLSKMPGVKIRPFFIDQSQLESLKIKEDWYNFFEVYPNENPVFLILPDPFLLDMNGFLGGMNISYPKCPVIGGLASASGQPRGNTLIVNDKSYDSGMVGLILTGNVRVETVVSQGCRPIAETYIVTKSEGNIIYEIAGKNFYEVLRTIYEKSSPRDQMLIRQAVFVGIAMDEYKHEYKRGDFLIRGLLGIDQQTGAGFIGDHIKTGLTIQFHVRDAQTATEDLNELLKLQQLNRHAVKPSGALVFSCNGRGEGLFQKKNHDIELIQNHLGPVPAAGFFCAGEIGAIGGQNFLHGFTNSMGLFYPLE